MNEERTLLLVCLGISLFIWTLMKLSGDFETTRLVKLKYELPDLIQFAEKPPEALTATLRGSGMALISDFVRNPNPSVSLELHGGKEQIIERYELVNAVKSEIEVELKDIDKSELNLVLDSMLNKKVPIVFRHELEFEDDFFPINNFNLSPDSAYVSGTPAQLAQIFHVETELVAESAITTDWSKKVKLQPPSGNTINISPAWLSVDVEVEQFTEKKINVPVQIPDSPDSIQLLPAMVEVKCIVALSRYPQLDATSLEVFAGVEDSSFIAEKNVIPVNVAQYPEWVRSVEVSPATVEYFIVQ